MSNYELQPAPSFTRDVKKFKRQKSIIKQLRQVLEKMIEDPFENSLRTHQVNIPFIGKVWSSRVTGDLRIIWEFDSKNKLVIIIIRFQGHDTVYS